MVGGRLGGLRGGVMAAVAVVISDVLREEFDISDGGKGVRE